MSDTPTPRTDERAYCFTQFGWKVDAELSRQLERELSEANAQHIRDEADYNELEADYRDSIAKHVECVEKLEAIIDAHKAVLTKSYNTLEEIVSSPFYQRTCRGGEMERLMNQAIKHLTSVNPNQASQ